MTIPAWQQQALLVLRAECLFSSIKQALEGGDTVTAVRLSAELTDTLREARELAEKARNQ